MSLLSLTTSLHYAALVPLMYIKPIQRTNRLNHMYENTILISTFLSILMHAQPESSLLFLTDYFFAGFWFFLDYLWAMALNKPIILELNIIVFISFILSLAFPDYAIAHSIWHIISAVKCFQVSRLIYRYDM